MSGQAYTIIIREDRDRRFALDAVRRARFGMQVKVSRATRTVEQNAKLHAMLTDMAEQLVWPMPPANDGELRDVEWWKRRCTLQWLIDRKERPEVVTALDDSDEIALLLPHTSDLTTEQCAELCEWIYSFGIPRGVLFKEPNGPQPPPPDPDDYR